MTLCHPLDTPSLRTIALFYPISHGGSKMLTSIGNMVTAAKKKADPRFFPIALVDLPLECWNTFLSITFIFLILIECLLGACQSSANVWGYRHCPRPPGAGERIKQISNKSKVGVRKNGNKNIEQQGAYPTPGSSETQEVEMTCLRSPNDIGMTMDIGRRAWTSAQGSALPLCASGHVGWEQGHFLTLEKYGGIYWRRSRYFKEKMTSPSSFLKRTQSWLGWLASFGGLKNDEFFSELVPSCVLGSGQLVAAQIVSCKGGSMGRWKRRIVILLLWSQDVREDKTKG